MIKPKQGWTRTLLHWMLWVFRGRTLFLLTRYVSSRLYRTARWSWVTTNRKTIFVSLWFSCESSRSPVFGNSSSRSGVMHRIALNTFGLKNSVLLILSPSIITTTAMFTTKATIYRPQIRKSQPRYSDFKCKHTIQAATAGPKVQTMEYQLELPSYFAR